MHLIIEVREVYLADQKMRATAVIGSPESQKEASVYQVDNHVLSPTSQIQDESLFARSCSVSIYRLESQPMISDNFSFRSLSI